MITKTPLRVSLFGGGSDIPDHFNKSSGHVLGFSINKYIHNAAINVKFDQDYKFRLSYKINEEVKSCNQISHPIYKVILNNYPIKGNWHFLSITDIPSGSGLGSSSTFTVGLIKLIRKITNNEYSDPEQIALEAINIERNVLKESGGWQDQIHAAYTGINSIAFENNKFYVNEIKISKKSLELMNNSMYIVFSGITRNSCSVEASKDIKNKTEILEEMIQISKEGTKELSSDNLNLRYLGNLLEKNWNLKKTLSGSVSSNVIDKFHDTIIEAGAYGAKLCGAGGGGFFFVLSNEESIKKLKQKTGNNLVIEKIQISKTDETFIRDEL